MISLPAVLQNFCKYAYILEECVNLDHTSKV